MKSLPTELVQSIAAFCTPQRRGSLLQTCRQVNADVRPTVQSCTVHLVDAAPGPALPSLHRFANLAIVNLVCTPAAAQAFTGPIVEFSSRQGTVTFHFSDSICTIHGATSARFKLTNLSDVATACRLTGRCDGLHNASYEGVGHSLEPLVHPKMEELRLYDVVPGHLDTPNLNLLLVQSPARVVHALLDHLDSLRIVIISAESVCPCMSLPHSVRHLVLEVSQPQELLLPPLPALDTMTLSCIVTTVDLSADFPSLRRLELIDSFLEGATPDELLEASLSHPNLGVLAVNETRPGTHRLNAWMAAQDEFDGLGHCASARVELSFILY